MKLIINPQTAHFTWATSNTLVRIGISATLNLYICVIFFNNILKSN